MKYTLFLNLSVVFLLVGMVCSVASASDELPGARSPATVRIASAQPKNRTHDFHLKPAEALAQVEKTLDELEKIVAKAGAAGCNVLALPEDTLGLLKWELANHAALKEVLPQALSRMLERLGQTTAQHKMYLVLCSDTIEPDGITHNTAFLLGRDGKEIGRYHKVNLPLGEQSHARGKGFPVFKTPELGGVGMLICYDMVFPEAARCLALGGADIIFHPTLGGAAIGDGDISLAAFRTRAVENFVYLVVSQRGNGSMIISPKGTVIARGKEVDGLAIADIDPAGGREGGDAFNTQRDIRGRLFRERAPETYGILTDPKPPVLAKVPSNVTKDEAIRIMSTVLTNGEERFNQARALARAGKTDEAIRLFEKLCEECPTSWIDRVSRAELQKLRPQQEKKPDPKPEQSGDSLCGCSSDGGSPEAPLSSASGVRDGGEGGPGAGIAAAYPGDQGIEKDRRVVFVENFENKSLDETKKRWETVSNSEVMTFTNDVPSGSGGMQSLLMSHVGGKGTGGQLYRRLPPGHDKLHARFYVKFDPDCNPIHHFGTTLGGHHPPTPWPMVSAGNRPAGDKTFWAGIEPFGSSWVWDYYTYWCEMRGSPPKGQTWGNTFVRDPKLTVERGKWICVELMMKMNDVGDTNGEMALWIDGKPISHLGKGFPKGKWVFDKFLPGEGGEGIRWNDAKGDRESFEVPQGGQPFEGFRWRTNKELSLNYLWVYLYITQAPPGKVSRVWFDDIVVATEYIGPVRGRAEGEK